MVKAQSTKQHTQNMRNLEISVLFYYTSGNMDRRIFVNPKQLFDILYHCAFLVSRAKKKRDKERKENHES